MTLQNRVDPWGQLHANPSKSATRMGNRGILHDSENNIVRPWAHKGWVSCLISFKGIQRPSHFRRGIIPSCFSWMKRLPFLPVIARARIANEIAAMRSEKHGYRPMSPTRLSLIPSGCHKLTRSCTQNGLCVAEARSPMSPLFPSCQWAAFSRVTDRHFCCPQGGFCLGLSTDTAPRRPLTMKRQCACSRQDRSLTPSTLALLL